MSTTITPTEQNIDINVNNDVIDINVTNEIVDVNATTQQIDINVAGAYPLPSSVTSVFGRVGDVVATEGDYTLTQLGDVTLTSPSNGQVLKYNGTAWVNGTDAGGITSIATTSPITGGTITSTGTIGITQATTSTDGFLSSSDWNTFNNKQVAGNYVTLDTFQTITASKTFSVGLTLASAGGTNQLTSFVNTDSIHSGSAGSNILGFNNSNNIYFGKGLDNGGVISWNNSAVRYYALPNADGTIALTSDIPSLTGYVPYTGATANLDLGTHTLIAAKGTFSSSGSGDTVGITHSSGSGIALNITKGGSGEGLYINKTSGSGNAATIIGTLNATTLVKSGGTSSQYLMADGSTSTLTNPVTGTGAIGQVAYWNGTSSITGESNLFWDATNDRLGIGTNAPNHTLQVYRNTSAGYLASFNSGATLNTNASLTIRIENSNLPSIQALNAGAGGFNTFALNPLGGNILVGTTTDAGFRLDVNGTARVQSVATFLDGLRINGGFTTFNSSIIFGSAAQSGSTFDFRTQYVGSATGATNFFNFTGTLASTTGGSFVFFNMAQTLSNANVAQTYRGIYYNPTVTGLVANTPHIAFENTSGNVLLCTTSGNVAIGTSTLGTATELTLGGSQTASSAIARGGLINTTLVAAANNDVLVGLDINPTFTNGAFTGVTNYALRTSDNILVTNNRNSDTEIRISNTTSNTASKTQFGATSSAGSIFLQKTSALFTTYKIINGGDAGLYNTSGDLYFLTEGAGNIKFAAGASSTVQARIFANGNFGINQNTDAGFRLDVNGTARVQGNTTITTSLAIGTTYSNSFFPKLLMGGNATGDINVFSVIANNTIQSDVTNNYQTFRSAPSTQATAFTLTTLIHYNLLDVSKGAGSTITNQYGIYVNDLVSATNNFGIYGNISSGTNRWNLYMAGTAANYMAGILTIGSASPNASAQLQVDSTVRGFLPPRMTTTQRTAISSPAAGLVVYDTTLNVMTYYNGTLWILF
jgi:hypothetical protein